MYLSLKPIALAAFSTSWSPGFASSVFSISTIFFMASRNSGVIMVISQSFSMLRPRRSSSATAKMPSSLNWPRYSSISPVGMLSNLARRKWQTPISRERTDLSKHSSRLAPMPMTSPVAFIWVPSTLGAVANLSKGKRGILATT